MKRPARNNGGAVGGVFCMVRSEAISLDRPSSVQLVNWSRASWLVGE
jgi:hypothetical protein